MTHPNQQALKVFTALMAYTAPPFLPAFLAAESTLLPTPAISPQPLSKQSFFGPATLD